ncbi:sigma-70 family RNA polymerase sigma factor [Paenibacillus alkalitolerans]|uniref:sigma-70 family RNA polymerase sigma factor n=1 Tax=Paenibacillus alkalitolerans TaxID=2799335 RepID=UPI0018F33ACB|nr:sigma-70 family RNA polymerase sigma factor [Paenibacillus alkalitolerans]
MDKLESYRDLCKEIELWEIRLDDLKTERFKLLKPLLKAPQTKLCASYEGMPGAGMQVINFAKEWDRITQIDESIEEVQDILSLKREAKKRMEQVISKMSVLEYRVAIMRDVERKKLNDIAEELGYSYEWIRKISMRTKRLRIG